MNFNPRLVLVLLACGLSSFGQKISVTPAPPWSVSTSYGVEVTDTTNTGGYYYLLFSRQFHAETHEVYSEVAIRVLNENGLSFASSFEESYDPSYETFRMHSLHLVRNGRKIEKLFPRDFQVLQRETNLSRQEYDGSLSVINNITGVQVGDIVVYSFTTAGANKAFGDHFFRTLQFSYGVPMGKILYRITASTSHPLFFKDNLNTPARSETVKGDLHVVSWEAEHVGPVIRDDAVPDWYNPYNETQVTDFGSWRELSQWAKDLFKIDMKRSVPLRRFIDSLQAIPGQEAQVVAAVRAVQDNIRYLSLSNGISGYQPHPPSQVFENRYGDCKDKSVLLAEVLKQLGVDAYPVLVNSSEGKALPNMLAAPWNFDHCIVQFNYKDSTYWVDPTINFQRGSLKKLTMPRYHHGLVVGKVLDSLLTIPATTSSQRITVLEDYQIDEIGGDARLVVTTKYAGGEADQMRDYKASRSQEEIDKNFLNFYASDFPEIVKAKAVRFEDDTVENIFSTYEEYVVPSFWKYDSSKSRYEAETYARYLSSYLYRPTTKVRTMPYETRYPLSVSQTIKLHMPEPWSIEEYHKSIKGNGLNFTTSWYYSDNVIRLEYDLTTTGDHIPAASTANYLRDVDGIYDELSFVLTYTPANTGTSGFNTPLLLIVICFGGLLFFGLKWMHDYDPSGKEGVYRYTSIGGWLILPAIGVTLSPFLMLFDMMSWDVDYFNYNQWRILADSSYAAYNPLLGLLIIFELLMNLTLVGYSIVLAFLFWMKRTSVPGLAIAFFAGKFILLLTDALAGKYFDAEIETSTINELIRAFVGAVIWIPYFVRSERVLGTFTVRIR